MLKYKIHPKLIDSLAEIYTNNKTKMFINNKEICEIEITNGIRQGCNGSTTIFLMLTYYIIEKLNISQAKFRNDIITLAAIFFADDGLLLAANEKEAQESIKMLIEIAKECGLKLNKEKSSILVFNSNSNTESIENIKVTDQIKYLGVIITNKRNFLLEQKKRIVQEANKYANIMPSVTRRSCNKILIGSTYWKSIVLPTIMYAQEIICYTKGEIEKIQRAENKAYKYVMNAPNYTPTSALRAEVGASSQAARDMKTKLNYVRHIMQEGNKLLKTIFEDLLEKNTDPWMKIIRKYMTEVNLNINKISNMKKGEIDNKIKEWDKECWMAEIETKKTLRIYQKYKKEIKTEKQIYDNTQASDILFQLRTNTLQLAWRNKYKQEETKCPLCSKEEEDVQHFLLYCPALQNIRNRFTTIAQQPYQENIMKIIMLFERKYNNQEEIKKYLLNLWNKRKSILKQQQQQQQQQQQ